MSSEPRPDGTIHRGEWLCIILLMLGLSAAAHYSMLKSGFVFTQGSGDSVLANYRLEHNWRWILREPPHTELFSPPMFFPRPHMAAISDLFLGAVPFYAIWRVVGATPQTAYQLFLFAVSALNFLSAYWLLRATVKTGPVASATGAILFAFGSPRMMKMGHAQMVVAFYMVWAMAGLWLIFRERPRPWTGAMLVAVSLALQLYTAFYYAWFSVFSACVALVYVLFIPALRRALIDTLRSSWEPLAAGAVLGALLVAPAAVEYGRVLNQVGGKSFAEVTRFLPNILAWFAQGPTHAMYGWLNRALGIDRSFGFGEMFDGVGLLTTVLIVAAFVKFRQRPLIAIWGAVCAVVLLATLSWHGVTLWRLIYPVFPGAQAVRVVSRFGVFLLLPAAMGVALSIDWLAKRYSLHVAVVCAAIVLAEQAGSFLAVDTFNKDQLELSAENVVHSLRPECKTLLFSSTKGGTTEGWMHLIGMWAGLIARVPALNGYQWPPGSPISGVEIADRFDRVRLYDGIRTWMLEYPQLESVCWVSPGSSSADMVRREDLGPEQYAIRRAYLALLGRLPAGTELSALQAAAATPRAFVAAVETLPEFRERELFAFAGYRQLFDRDPPLTLWIGSVEDLATKGKSRAQLVEEWKQSEECRARKECTARTADEVIRLAIGELPPREREHDDRALMYYCLLHRAPGAADVDDDAAIRAAW